ncbi:MAG: pectin esterase, partial [Bacteroidales bacterium]|nr:pectin esterase [Bacteroidales bacterium]
VALHTEGDRIVVKNCRLIGNQDTLYTGGDGNRLLFTNSYIEGTTDFIFGSATAWFEECVIHCKKNSYITAASTPKDVAYGYIFNQCEITLNDEVSSVYLGRPWRPYAATIFMNCIFPKGIQAKGWDNWRNADNEKTARYAEFNNKGEGSNTCNRVDWVKILSKNKAENITLTNVMKKRETQTPFCQ